MRKRIGMAIMLLLLVLAGCGQATLEKTPKETESPSETTQADPTNTTAQVAPAEPAEPAVPSKNIDVYMANGDLTELRKVNVSITYQEEADKYRLAFIELTRSVDPELEPLWREHHLKGIYMKEGILHVDVVISTDEQLGSTGEMMALLALQNTFFQFDEISEIQILVDGEIQETLMGHVDISKPFKKQ